MSYHLPSAQMVVEIDAADAGMPIELDITIKSTGTLSEVTLGHGNDVWFPIIKSGLLLFMVAVTVIILGIIVAIIYAILNPRLHSTGAVFYMSMVMIVMGVWVLSESRLRQFIFTQPSMSSYFAYMSLELVMVFLAMYFDDVQHRVYHRRYIAIEIVTSLQIIVNIILNVLQIKDLYSTLRFSHIWMAVGLVLVVVNSITDIVKDRIKSYRVIAIGMAIFLLLSLIELVGFYLNKGRTVGVHLLIGLMAIMFTTVIQLVLDTIEESERNEALRTRALINTIETFAGSIDAKDEHTGGHSDRVGEYAMLLARAMAADYDFTEEDIERVRYIGQLHDIGKIGVADEVLNKPGKLEDEEFFLMKKHPEIGYEMLLSMNTSIEGLLDGVRYHHERFDGKGYPDGLSGTDIPLIARIICIADCYDAMTSNRVYRQRLSDQEVKNEFIRCSGTQFDPALTAIFVRMIDSGQIRPLTEEGVALDQYQQMPASSKLENLLHQELQENEQHVLHASHINMMCYIMKLNEKKDKQVIACLIPSSQTDKLMPLLGRHDMALEYTKDQTVVAIFDQTEAQVYAMLTRADVQGQVL